MGAVSGFDTHISRVQGCYLGHNMTAEVLQVVLEAAQQGPLQVALAAQVSCWPCCNSSILAALRLRAHTALPPVKAVSWMYRHAWDDQAVTDACSDAPPSIA